MPVFWVAGNHDFLRRRSYEKSIKAFRNKKFQVEYCEPSLVGDHVYSLVDSRRVVVIQNPDEFCVEKVMGVKEPRVSFLLYSEGSLKGKLKTLFSSLPKGDFKYHQKEEKPWDVTKKAVEFCESEAKRLKSFLPQDLAEGLVRLCGVDYGFLSYELEKAALLASASGESSITLKVIKGAVAPLTEAMIQPLLEAVARRDRKNICYQLSRIQTTHKDDPTIRICRTLLSVVMKEKWLRVILKKSQGMGFGEISAFLGMNEWYLQRKIYPKISGWTPSGLSKLLEILGTCERNVLKGVVSPWLNFSARLLEICE